VLLASVEVQNFTAVLMQGSGTFSVESVLGSVIPESGHVLIISNGAYGHRMEEIASRMRLSYTLYEVPETEAPDPEQVRQMCEHLPEITHVSVVHCETTTGILNPVREIAGLAHEFGKIVIVDAMSSFGGIPIDMEEWHIDFLVSSANKCIQGVPGFGFVIARTSLLEQCARISRSLSLDLFDQWTTMEKGNGKWRFTSPTHVVRAFMQALLELEAEGGVKARYDRYRQNRVILTEGMRELGFRTLLPDALQSPIITSFESPSQEKYDFLTFYQLLKQNGFVIYPGKITDRETFRIGHIGEVYPADMYRLLEVVSRNLFWL
jgi:2-aminoethylphosphonate-pyruvate transaminase